ncbi:DUF4349 domain-containing protein [Halpernia sp.]|uniref:DUF4349 domain-containing protein n=1 Tax=Halpernia sp. TaxID=2782209 RepID=UPI003A9566F3
MKVSNNKFTLLILSILLLNSCKKQEANDFVGYTSDSTKVSTENVSDSISYAVRQNIKDKQFVKSADISMEVNDVYKSTIEIEKYLINNGGFVILSSLNSEIISDETYNTSNEKATLVRKYQTENSMEVRVPTEKLGDFLEYINNQKLFLKARNISAEDITANIRLAKLESNRMQKNGQEISKLKTNAIKVNLSNENESEKNYQQIQNFITQDNLKYSSVKIYLKEPKIRITEIAITNSKNIDNQYKFNFFYDLKNAFVEGFYLIQKIIIGLFRIWPLLIIAFIIIFFYKKRKNKTEKEVTLP